MFRTYDPATGRYLEPDPIGLGVTEMALSPSTNPLARGVDANLYAYAGGNSANRIDPTGLYYCVYSIALHTMTCVPNSPGNPVFSDSNFLSGSNFRNPECNDCRDNENRINVLNTGPLPPGYYNIERQLPNSTRRPLTPDPKFKYNSYGRTGGFQTHFCPNPRDCSEGCIATPSMPIMDRLNGLLGREEGDNQLTVLP